MDAPVHENQNSLQSLKPKWMPVRFIYRCSLGDKGRRVTRAKSWWLACPCSLSGLLETTVVIATWGSTSELKKVSEDPAPTLKST